MALRIMASPLRLALLAACLAGLTACSDVHSTGGQSIFANSGGIFGNLAARRPREDYGVDEARGLVPVNRGVGATQNFPGEGGAGSVAVASQGAEDGAGGQDYLVNFDNAPIQEVIRSVMSDALQLNYTLSGDVSGQITVSSARPVSRDDLLSVLETVLSLQGFTMTKVGDSYRIGPADFTAGTVDAGGRTRPGFGISVVPLRYVSAATMNRLLSGFIADVDGLRVDSTRNAIIVKGSGAAREETVNAVLSFDADWMQGQSVSIFEVRQARPEAIVDELEEVFATEGNGGAIEFKPIGRLRAVMALSKNPALIRRAETWIRRLDQGSALAGENVFVYRARYRDAKELARIASNLFGGGGGDTGAEAAPAPTSEVVPEPEQENGDLFAGPAQEDAGGQAFQTDPAAEQNSGAPEVIDLTQDGRNGPPIRISADASNNSVITYTDGETYQKVLAALRALDSTPLQVAINVIIAEVRLTNELRYGVQYFVKAGNLDKGGSGSVSLFSEAANTLQKQIPGFNFLVGTNANPDLIISALDRITDVEVLSSPSLVVLENQTASLQVGDEVPVTVRQAQSIDDPTAPIVNQIEFRDTGIILTVTPRIGQNDAVTMQIAQEISSVSGGANTLTPTISKRKIASNISVVSGQTVLLAGLISQSREGGRSGIPGVGRLPGLGNLFSTTAKSVGRTELVVLIRPVVIHSGEDAQSVAEEFRGRLLTLGGPEPAPPVGAYKD